MCPNASPSTLESTLDSKFEHRHRLKHELRNELVFVHPFPGRKIPENSLELSRHFIPSHDDVEIYLNTLSGESPKPDDFDQDN